MEKTNHLKMYLLLTIHIPSRELTYPPDKAYLKMIFLFPRWDMLIPCRVVNFYFMLVFWGVCFIAMTRSYKPKASTSQIFQLNHRRSRRLLRQEEDQFWVTYFFPTILLMAEILHQLIVYPLCNVLYIGVQDFFHQQYHT